jgi:hypothetical protein
LVPMIRIPLQRLGNRVAELEGHERVDRAGRRGGIGADREGEIDGGRLQIRDAGPWPSGTESLRRCTRSLRVSTTCRATAPAPCKSAYPDCRRASAASPRPASYPPSSSSTE